MAVITFPTALESYVAQQAIGQRRFDTFDASDVTGAVDVVIGGPPRWTMQLNAHGGMELPIAGLWDALMLQLRGGVNYLAVHDLLRPLPTGTARGSGVTVGATVAGAVSAAITGARAGSNLIRPITFRQTFLIPTTLSNATAVTGISDPQGGTSAFALTRTATGNHFAFMQATTAGGARTVGAYVWLRSGTLTGNVTLRLRDGADVEFASLTVTPTATWTVYRISGRAGAASAANVRLFVDPANDTGSAGDTLQVWFSEITLAAAADELCVSWRDAVAAPAEFPSMWAWRVVRSGAGNAFSLFFVAQPTTALRTWTYSVWLRADTFSGVITLYLRDGAGATYGTTVCNITSQWQRFSVSAVFPAGAAANVQAFIDPNDGGSIGEAYERFGDQLEEDAAPSVHAPLPTLRAGDWLQIGAGVGSHYAKVVADVTLDEFGAGSVTFEPPTRQSYGSGTAVVLEKARGHFKRASSEAGWQHTPGAMASGGHGLELVEQWS